MFLAAAIMPTAFAEGAGDLAIIPQPQQIKRLEGNFALTPQTQICADASGRQTAEFLAQRLRASTGYPLAVKAKGHGDKAGPDEILLTSKGAGSKLGAEGYELVIHTNTVTIRAPAEAGLFYGAQTLLQLLPPDVFGTNASTNADWRMPCVQITDWPRFPWRGLMLDVSRHFFTKPEIESLLGAMALHKMNRFHWHLTDDQGWRIEIKKYPKLTQLGAWRDGIGFRLPPSSSTNYGPDGRYGGFYTQDDIREIVACAQKLHITIVPEIEMPGHSTAALQAYPQFVCPGVTLAPLSDRGGISHGIYCAGNEETFAFIDDVMSEVAGLFPGPYIHIGGDECPKGNWRQCELCQARIKKEGLKDEEQLQSYFVRRVGKILQAHGKMLIGWSEIRQGGLAPGVTLMDWKGGGVEAASSGHDVVIASNQIYYLNRRQSTNLVIRPRATTTRTMTPPLLLEKVYEADPVPTNLPPRFQKHILGAQASLWTESIANLKRAELQLFPRLSALAEATWTQKERCDVVDFKRRVQVDNQRLGQLGIEYWHEPSN